MCGIFGISYKTDSEKDFNVIKNITDDLFLLSESRGKESAGIAIKNYESKKISILKKDIPAKEFINRKNYKKYFFESINSKNNNEITLIAHSRLVTNGIETNNYNNQPVQKDSAVLVHNGIVTNVIDLWKKFPQLNKKSEVDSEFILSYINRYKSDSIAKAICEVFKLIEGSASIAFFDNISDRLLLATNTGSLYYYYQPDKNIFVFASEKYILQKILDKYNKHLNGNGNFINWLKPFKGLVIPGKEKAISEFSIKDEYDLNDNISIGSKTISHFEVIDYSDYENNISYEVKDINLNLINKKLLEYNESPISKMKRCTKCLLPETFPFIEFDNQGICNYCNNYTNKYAVNKSDKIEKIFEKHRSKNKTPDCIVAFSGGRDSSYGLHLLKNVFGMTPITFTYDWGMVTDLARRNIARLTGKLGVENILVSANIKKKRENIRKNVSAWLKNPKLGMIPLFMAGDKQFYYYSKKIKEHTNIKVDVWLGNPFENTDFKSGFCGIKPNFEKSRLDYLSIFQKAKMGYYYLKNFLISPGYFNSSLFDTFFSFYSYYGINSSEFVMLYDYVKFEEAKIEKTLIDEYNWETSPDTISRWRIGDGTAPFYNYIYYTIAGFSEFDTFRSNQIREGMIAREEALKLINEENKPRYESLKWYLDTIGLDFENTIKIINNVPKLYK